MIKIIASCNPYNAKFHYNGQEVVKYDGSTPVQWVMGNYDSIEEAKEALWGFAMEDCNSHDDLSHEYEEDIEQGIIDLAEEEDMSDEEVKELRDWYASWFKGEGIYYNDSREVLMLKGDASYSYDVMSYGIEDIEDENAAEEKAETYDIYFNDDADSNNKGFSMSLEECKDWIEFNRGESYFKDYKGGTVSIVCNETGETVYEENI